MIRVRVGGEVMAPHPRSGGGFVLKSARVLVVMPELAIVEYYEDGMRHCLPHSALRAPFDEAEALRVLR